ncbi:protein RKD1-like [Ipomoea triloba]|uniref:protein RKD1-like n=1 Tax=Ipomoea triloba TaxID=35885 RepID=UPI00125CEDEB|nr:protein RKD1-like [Ipomoea triloba]
MESKLIALDKCCEEAEWLRHFLEDIPNWERPVPPICVHCDSQATLGRVRSHMYNGCSDDTSVESSEVGEVTIVEDNSSKKEGRGRRPVPSTLSREVISSYFHMPVCQAAEELGIGETTLKERCRKVGIPRWPHRKLKSLEALMKNVQDFEENPKDALTRATIGVLKNRHKLLSDMPGSNLDPETLCLRNAYFKLNYLKRKLRRAMISSSPSVSSPWTPISTACIGTEGDEEDMDIPLKELLRRSKASPPSFVNVVTPVMIEGVPPNG